VRGLLADSSVVGKIDIIGIFADDSLMRYPGGKGRTYQQLINLMPPHRRYIETHLGCGAVMRNKLPAEVNIGIDIDQSVIDRWRTFPELPFQVVQGNVLDILPTLQLENADLIYMDPPYFPTTRRRARVYRHDYSHGDHEQLLSEAVRLPCMVLISGYRCELYDDVLATWNRHDYAASTHTGMRSESVWFNFPPPKKLHDPRFVGENFRKRQDTRRRMERLREKITGLSHIEQAYLLDWLEGMIRETATQPESFRGELQ
jgi:DNA adenine methylase